MPTKSKALADLKKRKKANAKRKQVRNSDLPAGSPMYYYCRECGDLADTLPESHIGSPRKLCTPCQALKDAGLIVA